MDKQTFAALWLQLGLVLLFLVVSSESRSVMLFGASGAVGSEILRTLVTRNEWNQIYSVGRRHLNLKDNDKVHQIVVPDLMKLESLLDEVKKIDACIIAVGDGYPMTSTLADWHKIDIDIAEEIARFCKDTGAGYVNLLSSAGVDETAPLEPFTSEELKYYDQPLGVYRSISLYFRLKRLAENVVVQSKVPVVHVFRPSNIITPESRYGWFDKFVFFISPWIDPIVPWEYHSVHSYQLGRAMALDAEYKLTSAVEQQVEYLSYENFRKYFKQDPTVKDEL